MVGQMLFWVSYNACVPIFFYICTCSAQLSMFHTERRSRNTNYCSYLLCACLFHSCFVVTSGYSTVLSVILHCDISLHI